MVAQRIPGILPEMTESECLEVTKIYSIAGQVGNTYGLIKNRPFRSPHHNASLNALIGGGANAMPGEVSLAHNGVLFLDELAEFSRRTLDALRQPIEDKKVSISRVNSTHTFPSNFMFVTANGMHHYKETEGGRATVCKVMEEYGKKNKMLGVIDLGKKLGWTDDQIITQLVELYKITREAAKALLTPAAG